MQNITTRELKHLCNFLTHAMNYKVELVSEEDFAYDEEDGENVYDWIAATDELCAQTTKVLDNYFTKNDKTVATAFETAINYRYDDDCINEGIAEHFFDYCKKFLITVKSTTYLIFTTSKRTHMITTVKMQTCVCKNN